MPVVPYLLDVPSASNVPHVCASVSKCTQVLATYPVHLMYPLYLLYPNVADVHPLEGVKESELALPWLVNFDAWPSGFQHLFRPPPSGTVGNYCCKDNPPFVSSNYYCKD